MRWLLHLHRFSSSLALIASLAMQAGVLDIGNIIVEQAYTVVLFLAFSVLGFEGLLLVIILLVNPKNIDPYFPVTVLIVSLLAIKITTINPLSPTLLALSLFMFILGYIGETGGDVNESSRLHQSK